jgi:uncharacterized repeat protein (TIGR02543 family)
VKAVTGTSFASAATAVAVKSRPAAPAASVLTINYVTELFGLDAVYEMSAAATFATIVTGNSITPHIGSNLYIRVKAVTGTSFASAAATVAVKSRPAAPAASALTIDYAAETFGFGTAYEVSAAANFGTTVSGNSITPYIGSNLYIRVKAAPESASFASSATTVTVASRPAAPAASELTINYAAETAAFTTQYEASADQTFADGGKAVASGGSVTSYLGSNLYIRAKATGAAFAGSPTAVTVASRPAAPAASVLAIDYAAKTAAFDSALYEVSADQTFTDGGKAVTDGGSITTYLGGNLYVRLKAASAAPAGVAAAVLADAVESIAVKTNPAVTTYSCGVAFNFAGGVITAAWYGGGTTDISMADASVTPSAAAAQSTAGQQTVTFTYAGKTTAAGVTFTVNAYTVTLNADGGVYADGYTAPATYVPASGATLPAAAQISKYGYLFGGWYADAGFAGSPVTAVAQGTTGDKTYWAKWNPLVFNVSVQYADGKATVLVVPQGGAVSQTQAMAGIPVPGGYKFDGLYLDADYTQAYDESAPVTGDLTLYVKWTEDGTAAAQKGCGSCSSSAALLSGLTVLAAAALCLKKRG